MHKQLAWALVISGLLSGGAGCSRDSAQAATPAAAPNNPATTPTPPTATEDQLTISGPLIVEHQVEILAQRDGVIAKIQAETGTRVRTGEPLALLDDRQLSADMEAARAKTRSIAADLNNWEAEAKVLDADYQRAKKLWDAHVIPYEQLQHAQYKAESDQWDVIRVKELLTNSQQNEKSLELELEKTRIQAPFDGVVARRYIREGQQVAKGDHLFWVTAEAPLRLRFTLPERFLGHVMRGQQLPVTSPDTPGTARTARVVEVSPVVDPASGTIDVTLELAGAPGELRPGMTASVTLQNSR